jgi:hypothetical protein
VTLSFSPLSLSEAHRRRAALRTFELPVEPELELVDLTDDEDR